ncbi:MAG: SpoIIE family protein phosphatase [Deltaproteobacteria bacterium]|nr:SpoIIE family protein phosphatase [Deltaproteobacteria bacterium]
MCYSESYLRPSNCFLISFGRNPICLEAPSNAPDSKEIKLEECKRLQIELARLKSEKAALQAQSRLLENFVSLARSTGTEEKLISILQQTLEVFVGLTGAEKGSLFLLDRNGAVIESILTRADATPEQRSQLIGRVLDKGLAGWVREHRRIGIIEDTQTDGRWLDLPDQPYTVRSALAVPILRDEKLLGLLTLLHAQTGHFNQETAELMELTAAQIAIALENARLYAKLEKSYHSLERAKEEIESFSNALNAELEKGKKIQRDFLPNQIPRVAGWEIDSCFRPAYQVSGDFYDAFLLPGNQIALVIADVCDKGVGSALYMALFRSLLRVFSGQIRLGCWSTARSMEVKNSTAKVDPDQMLQAVSLTNDYIALEHGHENMFATLFFGILDPITGNLSYINGGHEPLFIIGPSGIKKILSAAGPAIGIVPGIAFEARQSKIEPGDILIGYTDGVTEALSPGQKMYSKERFLAQLEPCPSSANELIDRIKTDLLDHIDNAPQFDDITMIAIHRQAKP